MEWLNTILQGILLAVIASGFTIWSSLARTSHLRSSRSGVPTSGSSPGTDAATAWGQHRTGRRRWVRARSVALGAALAERGGG